MILCLLIPYTFWKKTAPIFFVSSLVLLILVLIPGIGTKSLGAQRWISLGVLSIQPSEIAKLALIISFAYLSDLKAKLKHYLFVLGIFTFLIMLQPDFGTTLALVAIGFSQMFIANIPLIYLLGISIFGFISGLLLIFTSDYRKARFLTFLESSDPLGTSYHIRQILIAIGSGGIFGVGLGQSRQKHLFLPETATDSVFAVLAEETGFVGGDTFPLTLL
jgi:cell division protein FtsW